MGRGVSWSPRLKRSCIKALNLTKLEWEWEWIYDLVVCWTWAVVRYNIPRLFTVTVSGSTKRISISWISASYCCRDNAPIRQVANSHTWDFPNVLNYCLQYTHKKGRLLCARLASSLIRGHQTELFLFVLLYVHLRIIVSVQQESNSRLWGWPAGEPITEPFYSGFLNVDLGMTLSCTSIQSHGITCG